MVSSCIYDATQQWHLATFFYNLSEFYCFYLMSYRKYRIRNGEIFLLYLVLYSFGRFFIEGLRTDSLYIGTIRVSQLLSVLFFILGIALIIYRRRTLSKKISVVNNVTEMKQYKSSKSDSEGCRNSMDDDTDNE